jgi:hypothetical protein
VSEVQIGKLLKTKRIKNDIDVLESKGQNLRSSGFCYKGWSLELAKA